MYSPILLLTICFLQHALGVAWNSEEGALHNHEVVPTLHAISLRWGRIPNVIVAAGRYDGIIVSEKGHVLERFGLPVRLQNPFWPFSNAQPRDFSPRLLQAVDFKSEIKCLRL